VQGCPALQELRGELGVFVEGGIEEALVGGEDDDQGEGVDWLSSGAKSLCEDSKAKPSAAKALLILRQLRHG
jgi:hypothetical protein